MVFYIKQHLPLCLKKYLLGLLIGAWGVPKVYDHKTKFLSCTQHEGAWFLLKPNLQVPSSGGDTYLYSHIKKIKLSNFFPEITSCRDVKICTNTTVDGHYSVRPVKGTKPSLKIYCHEMSSKYPKDFLTLIKENFTCFPLTRINLYRKICRGHYAGVIFYEKIRMDLNVSKSHLLFFLWLSLYIYIHIPTQHGQDATQNQFWKCLNSLFYIS